MHKKKLKYDVIETSGLLLPLPLLKYNLPKLESLIWTMAMGYPIYV